MDRIKKHRGLKRYYRNLAIKNDFDKRPWLDLGNSKTWFDKWHLHFDWKGYGNDSFKRRKPHLDKLFRHFDLLVDRVKEIKTDFQFYSISIAQVMLCTCIHQTLIIANSRLKLLI